jgi:Ca2+ transporting ATPase
MTSEAKSSAWHAQDAPNVLAHFRVAPDKGLSDDQVMQQRTKFGKNEIPPPPATSILTLIIEQFSDLLVLILLGAAFISFVLALFEQDEDRVTAFVEPAVILVILILNAVVGVVQETNAEKAIEVRSPRDAHRLLTKPRPLHRQLTGSASIILCCLCFLSRM